MLKPITAMTDHEMLVELMQEKRSPANPRSGRENTAKHPAGMI